MIVLLHNLADLDFPDASSTSKGEIWPRWPWFFFEFSGETGWTSYGHHVDIYNVDIYIYIFLKPTPKASKTNTLLCFLKSRGFNNPHGLDLEFRSPWGHKKHPVNPCGDGEPYDTSWYHMHVSQKISYDPKWWHDFHRENDPIFPSFNIPIPRSHLCGFIPCKTPWVDVPFHPRGWWAPWIGLATASHREMSWG